VEPLLDAADPAIAARHRDDLLPLCHRLARGARVVAADVAAPRACEEMVGRRGEVCEACVMHGLSQAQRVVRDLRNDQPNESRSRWAFVHWYNVDTHIFGSP